MHTNYHYIFKRVCFFQNNNILQVNVARGNSAYNELDHCCDLGARSGPGFDSRAGQFPG